MRTRPIFHSSDAAIRGHVFCSFLALVDAEASRRPVARGRRSCRNGTSCCAISTACSRCASAIAAPTGWCAPTPPTVDPVPSRPYRAAAARPADARRRNSSPSRNPPENAAAAPGVVPRHLNFAESHMKSIALQKSGVQVGLEQRTCTSVYMDGHSALSHSRLNDLAASRTGKRPYRHRRPIAVVIPAGIRFGYFRLHCSARGEAL